MKDRNEKEKTCTIHYAGQTVLALCKQYSACILNITLPYLFPTTFSPSLSLSPHLSLSLPLPLPLSLSLRTPTQKD